LNLETLKYIKDNPKHIFSMLASKSLLNWLPDEQYIKIQFRLAMGYWPDLNKPKTFSEKLQWLKLHDRKPMYTTLVDKYAVRKYVAETIGEEYLIPLVGGPWKNADEIDFDALPDRFVLKCNHDSGGVVVCKDKSRLDIEQTRNALNKRLRRNFYWSTREWPYKNVEPCILAEKYIENENGELRDYKWYCFDGESKFMLITTDRMQKDEATKYTYFDMDFTMLPFYQCGPHADEPITKPVGFDKMRELAEALSIGMPHVRVDMYDVNGKVYFGELTFYDSSGMEAYDPPAWDETIGSWLSLPEKK